jgi:FkbM family methyltransferase
MNNFMDRVAIKSDFTYYDNDEFKNGFIPEGFELSELVVRNNDNITSAMVMCWMKDHKRAFNTYVNDFNVVVQAGGFNGLYASVLSKIFSVVYTFEPEPLNFFCLANNCQEYNIIKMNAALGDNHSMIHMSGGSDSNAGTYRVVEDSDQGTSIIPQLMIDDLDLPDCNLIMLDIEGRELQALTGASRTIEKFKPVICLEVGPPEAGVEVAAYLATFGYTEKVYLRYASDKIFTVD